MASMFIKHRIGDFGKWKLVFDQHQGERKEYGFTAHSLHRDADDPNVIIVALRVLDVQHARAFASSESLRTAMERAGVVGAPEIWFSEDVEDKRY